jgi:EF-P beta-lysylation protein EpmB
MAAGDPNDPLLRQVLPMPAELNDKPGFSCDPVGDGNAQKAPGLLQKYRGRALLLATGACAIHCRYCFRRHFAYEEDSSLHDRAAGAIRHLASDESINEVILSGGDPLMLDDPALAVLIGELSEIDHLVRLRLHTRLPVVLPSRVTEGLCAMLAASRLQPIVVIQANHARELSPRSRRSLGRLREAGVTLLSQSVLLRDVNDGVDQLADLSEALFESGVLPYYLHLLDRVRGAAHFEVDQAEATYLMELLRSRLPGYLVPRLVREVAGRPFKDPV